MPHGPISAESQSPAVETFFLGQVPYLRCLELQQRLLRQVAQRDDGQVVILMCEHPPVITIGRGGRPSQVSGGSQVLRSRADRDPLDQSGGRMSGTLSRATGYLPYSTTAVASFLAGRISSSLSVGFGEYINRTGVQPKHSGSVRSLGSDGPDRHVRSRGPRLGYLARGLFECLTATGVISPCGKRSAVIRRWQHRCRSAAG